MNGHGRKAMAWSWTQGIAGLGMLWMAAVAEGQIVTNQASPIVINDNSTATPYPSIIDLTQSAVPGLIQKVSVTVSGLTAPFAPDIGLLLVGPNSNAVVLLSGCGLNTSGDSGVSGTKLTFRDEAPSRVPIYAPLLSGGTFKPTDSAGLAFVGPAPTTNYSPSLTAAFAGSSPNGLWQLYALDDSPGPSGPISSGIDLWSLTILVGPSISSTDPVQLPSEGTTLVKCTVADADGVVTNVTATVLDEFQDIIIKTVLEGTNVTMTLTPGPLLQTGTNVVETIATDDNGFRGTNHFILNVHAQPQPYFGPDNIPQQMVRAGTILGPLTFHVYDYGLPFFRGVVRAHSSDGKLLPDSNILVQETGLGAYTLTAFPQGKFEGSLNITIVADDGTRIGATTFNVIVQAPGSPLFVSPETIVINSDAPATPFPGTNHVNGLIGLIEHVTVTLFDVNAPAPGNVMALLVGPSGTNVLLMAGAGGNDGMTNTTLVFTDTATNALPQSGQISTGIYRPTSYITDGGLPTPAPPPGYGADLSVFKGTDPNGDWKLYVYDNGSAKSGVIANGWQLSVQTAPKIPSIIDQSTPENVTAKVTITVGDNQPGVPLKVTAIGWADLFQLPIVVTGSGTTRTLSIVPQPYAFGTNTIIVTVTDPEGITVSNQFQLGVQFVPQPPLFVSVPPDQVICWDDLEPILFSVWSPQHGPLDVTASSPDNPTLFPNVDVTQISGTNNGTNVYSLSLIPAGVLPGSGTILIQAADTNGQKSSASFKLNVPTDCGLSFAITNSISIPQGATNEVLQQGEATPYPSVYNVRGLDGVVKSVKAILIGFTHPHPEDVRVLLVSPDNSRATMLMGKAGSGGPAQSLRLTFIDGAPAIPKNNTLTDGSYSPADYSGGVSLPSPAPPAYSTSLAAFRGISPNGDWKLYVLDDTYPTGGSIDGWMLRLELNYPPTLLMEQSGNTLTVTFTGPTNRIYSVQTTADLTNWNGVGTVTTASDGTARFDIQMDPAAKGRFYRLVGP